MSAEGKLGEILEFIRASSPTEKEQIFQALAQKGGREWEKMRVLNRVAPKHSTADLCDW